MQVKYVGDGEEQNGGLQMTGLNLMDKTLAVRGARLAFNIWDVAGTHYLCGCTAVCRCRHQIAIALVQARDPEPSSYGMDAGDSQSADHIPIACKDAVAILFMFDLTSRCTLNKLVAVSSSVSQHLQAQRTNSESIGFFPSRP